jgi:hypothetical protein
MIKTDLEYSNTYADLKLRDLSYTCQPTSDEWETTLSMMNGKNCHATMVVSDTLYPTSHLYFDKIWKIYLTLERQANNEETSIKSIVEIMQKISLKEILETVLFDHLSPGHSRSEVQVQISPSCFTLR